MRTWLGSQPAWVSVLFRIGMSVVAAVILLVIVLAVVFAIWFGFFFESH